MCRRQHKRSAMPAAEEDAELASDWIPAGGDSAHERKGWATRKAYIDRTDPQPCPAPTMRLPWQCRCKPLPRLPRRRRHQHSQQVVEVVRGLGMVVAPRWVRRMCCMSAAAAPVPAALLPCTMRSKILTLPQQLPAPCCVAWYRCSHTPPSSHPPPSCPSPSSPDSWAAARPRWSTLFSPPSTASAAPCCSTRSPTRQTSSGRWSRSQRWVLGGGPLFCWAVHGGGLRGASRRAGGRAAGCGWAAERWEACGWASWPGCLAACWQDCRTAFPPFLLLLLLRLAPLPPLLPPPLDPQGAEASPLAEWTELENGCICCSAKNDMVKALEALLQQRSRFDYVLIETTGLANPGPVAAALWTDEQLESRWGGLCGALWELRCPALPCTAQHTLLSPQQACVLLLPRRVFRCAPTCLPLPSVRSRLPQRVPGLHRDGGGCSQHPAPAGRRPPRRLRQRGPAAGGIRRCGAAEQGEGIWGGGGSVVSVHARRRPVAGAARQQRGRPDASKPAPAPAPLLSKTPKPKRMPLMPACRPTWRMRGSCGG